MGAEHRAGLCSVCLISVATVCTTQLTRSAQNHLHAPGFVAYVHIAMMTLLVPLAWACRKDDSSPFLASAKDVCVFLPLWVVSNYGLVQALALAPAGLVQCLFGTGPAQVAILSRVFLEEPLTSLRILAVLLAFAGVLALAAHAKFQGDSALNVLLGTCCALLAVVAAACYKVAFKLRLGTPPAYVVLGVVGTLGLAATVLGLPVVLLLSFLGLEDRWWSSSVTVDWSLVFGSAAFDMVYNTSMAWGLAVSSPVFVSLGANVGTPVNMFVDAVLHGDWPSLPQYCGTVLIAISFIMLVFCESGQARPVTRQVSQSLIMASS